MNNADATAISVARPNWWSRTRSADLPGMAAVFAQLVLGAFVMRKAALETLGFRRVVYISVCGFVVHHFLPVRLRLRFFLALSVFSMVVALGGSASSRTTDPALGLSRSILIGGIGVLLIAICHLPVGFWKRASLLVLAGVFIAVFRSGKWDSRVLAVVWPVIAAIFMFRIMVYLYDLSIATTPPTKTQSLAYFFLIPNFCALLFPVIDFRTFCKKYYDEAPLVIYQRGVKWMTRGIIQLLIYRLAHQLFGLEASEIADGTNLVQYVVANVFLYLKVSGSFHLFIGMLLLFGFNLPETNHRYLLAASFTDYWRRINIYWRAFIMKAFYYPIFFRFKKSGQVPAMMVAIVCSFFVTWALHVYQTWWIKGAVSLSWTDTLFWTALCALVLANSLWELKRKRKKKLAKGTLSPREAIGVVVRTALTFTVITVLWSLWCTPTLGLWRHIWSFADWDTLKWGSLVLLGVMVATVMFELLPLRRELSETEWLPDGYSRSAAFRRHVLQCTVPLLAILVLGQLPGRSQSGLNGFQPSSTAAEVVRLVLGDGAQQQGRGYYENLTAVDESTSQFWETMTTSLFFINQATFTNDSNAREFRPNIHEERNGLRLDTNRWGMRDSERDLAKIPATLRMAFLGSSHVMGYGLPINKMFQRVLEDRLNKEHQNDGAFEIVNFAVSGQSPLGQIWMLQNRALAFHPDIVFFVAHLVDFEWVSRDVVANLRARRPLPNGFPIQVLSQVGDGRFDAFAMLRLRPSEPEMLAFCYREMVRQCRSIDALPVCVFLPLPEDLPLDGAKAAFQLQLAKAAGFTTIDLSNVFTDYNPNDLMLPESVRHSNAKAHAIIAAALYDQLMIDPNIDLIKRARRIRSLQEGRAPTQPPMY